MRLKLSPAGAMPVFHTHVDGISLTLTQRTSVAPSAVLPCLLSHSTTAPLMTTKLWGTDPITASFSPFPPVFCCGTQPLAHPGWEASPLLVSHSSTRCHGIACPDSRRVQTSNFLVFGTACLPSFRTSPTTVVRPLHMQV